MDTRQLRDHFNRHAVEFDRLYHPGRQSTVNRCLNRCFRTDITGRYLAALEHIRASGAASVLDVGCGPGHYLAALAEMGIPRIVGIDAAEEMLALARQNPGIIGKPNVELVHADYSVWSTDERFDVILAIGFFDYVESPGPLLQRMREQSGHSVFASFPSRHWLRTPVRWARRRAQRTSVYFYTAVQIEELGRATGFRDVTVTKLPGAGMNFIAVFQST